jgi:hypothetical protein
LFECASNKEATVDSVLVRHGDGVIWNVNFVHHFNDWELDVVASFLHVLHSHIPRVGNDGLWWMLNRNGLFDIQSFYIAIRDAPRVVFLGEVFGVVKPHEGYVSLFGPWLGIKF